MREFSQVMPTFWTGDTGKRLKGKPEIQLLALYLITNPHSNAFGLYYLPLPFITHETGMTEKKISAGFRALPDFCRYDRLSEFVWVIAMAGFQLGHLKLDDNRLKGFQRAWQGLPQNPFTADFWDKYGLRYGLERRASKGLTGPSEALRLLETDTEREMETAGAEHQPDKARPESAEAVTEYAKSLGFELDGQHFIDTYEKSGWVFGKNRLPIKDWRACVRTWKRHENGTAGKVDISEAL